MGSRFYPLGLNYNLGDLSMMYDRLEQAVEEKGEVMVQFDSGKEAELHKHNVEFLEEPIIKVDADDRVHWFNAEKVERYWIHEDF